MAATKEAPAAVQEFVGRPGRTVRGKSYGEALTAEDLAAIPYHKLQVLRRDRYIVNIRPPATRPESVNPAPVETKEAMQHRLAREWLIAQVRASGCNAGDVWQALVRGDDRIVPQGATLGYVVPPEAAYLARLWEAAQ